MQNVIWDDDNLPTFLIEDDELQVLDYPAQFAFELGDQVQYFLDERVFVYRVVHIQPELPGEEELNCVTLRRVC